jgi:toxin ParE1/3/4
VFARRVFHTVDRLSMFPESGRVVPEREDRHVREIIVQQYRVLYRYDGRDVEVVAIYHGARRLPLREID